MAEATVAPPAAPVVALVRGVVDLVEAATSVEDCVRARDVAAEVLALVEPDRRPRPGESRHPVVRALGAAVVHLGRAGGPVGVEQGRTLAWMSLVEAAEQLEAEA